MKSLKKFFAGMLAICLIFCLCACGSSNEVEENQNAENQVEDNESADAENNQDAETDAEAETETAAGFKVMVVDESQNPVEGVMVQMCKDTCVPAKTDAEGVATFNIEDVDGYKLSVLSCPEGFEYTGEAEIYLESGSAEYTIELNGGN